MATRAAGPLRVGEHGLAPDGVPRLAAREDARRDREAEEQGSDRRTSLRHHPRILSHRDAGRKRAELASPGPAEGMDRVVLRGMHLEDQVELRQPEELREVLVDAAERHAAPGRL